MKDLSVRSENIQRIYSYYINEMLLVNRRYQRKLVWSVEEKAAFIDSIIKGYPVPLILLAEFGKGDPIKYEIIDGMQRLDAIISFIIGDFAINGFYFDLEAMAESKRLLDEEKLTQKLPKLDRKTCADNIASYSLPLSIYKMDNESQIDEIFRRINSNGRHLSKQEIRQAGSISHFAELVRLLASEIRGDVSLENRLLLNDMKTISITSKDLNYGIDVDTVFWVSNSIIRREQVRESKDEEIIADLLAYALLDEKPRSSSSLLDEFYGLTGDNRRSKELDEKIKIRDIDKIKQDFYKVFDLLKSIIASSEKRLSQLMFKDKISDQIPRYFQIVFLALYDLLIIKNKKVASLHNLVTALNGIGSHISLGQGGGNWSARERETNVDGISGILAKYFTDNVEDPAMIKWSMELETILKQSTTEQTSFDFKLGFCNLNTKAFSDETFHKCIKTLTAMANRGKGYVGYVIVGVADKFEDAKEIERIVGEKAVKSKNFYITGVNHDVNFMGLTDDKYYQYVIQKLEKEPIQQAYKSNIANNIKFIDYVNKKVIIMKITALSEPAIYNGKIYERRGANIFEIEMSQAFDMAKRFI